MGAKKHLADGKELNTLATSAVAKSLKVNNNYKSMAMENSDTEYDSDKFNFKKSIS